MDAAKLERIRELVDGGEYPTEEAIGVTCDRLMDWLTRGSKKAVAEWTWYGRHGVLCVESNAGDWCGRRVEARTEDEGRARAYRLARAEAHRWGAVLEQFKQVAPRSC